MPLEDPAQLRMARAALNIGLVELRNRSGVNKGTIQEWEKGKSPRLAEPTLEKLNAFFEEHVIFIPAKKRKHGVGVVLRLDAKPLNRAGRTKNPLEPASEAAGKILAYWKERPDIWGQMPEEYRAATLEMIFDATPDVDPIIGADSAKTAAE